MLTRNDQIFMHSLSKERSELRLGPLSKQRKRVGITDTTNDFIITQWNI